MKCLGRDPDHHGIVMATGVFTDAGRRPILFTNIMVRTHNRTPSKQLEPLAGLADANHWQSRSPDMSLPASRPCIGAAVPGPRATAVPSAAMRRRRLRASVGRGSASLSDTAPGSLKQSGAAAPNSGAA